MLGVPRGKSTWVVPVGGRFDPSATTYLGVQFVENVLQIVAFDRLFRIKQIEEFLHELLGHVALKLFDLNRLVDNELQEELIDALEVRPRRVHLFLLVDTSLSEVQLVLVDAGERAEDVLLDHLHRLIKVRHNGANRDFLVTQHGLQFLDRVEALGLYITKIGKGQIIATNYDRKNENGAESGAQVTVGHTYLALHILLLVLVVIRLHAHLELLDVLLLRVFI